MKSTFLTLFMLPFLLILVSESKTDSELDQNPVVLELFTSQGCSSCPPADTLLKTVKSEAVIALSYHVDYWNYIGWKDPFSTAKFTERQRKYGSKFRSSSIYTPQVVVNGQEHFVGSKRQVMTDKIAEYSKQKAVTNISISEVKQNDGIVNFTYKIDGLLPNENLRVILVINERKTSVKRGENRNRELVNSNIVVAEKQFKIKNETGKGSIIIPDIVLPKDELLLVLILENDAMDIHAAAQTQL